MNRAGLSDDLRVYSNYSSNRSRSKNHKTRYPKIENAQSVGTASNKQASELVALPMAYGRKKRVPVICQNKIKFMADGNSIMKPLRNCARCTVIKGKRRVTEEKRKGERERERRRGREGRRGRE